MVVINSKTENNTGKKMELGAILVSVVTEDLLKIERKINKWALKNCLFITKNILNFKKFNFSVFFLRSWEFFKVLSSFVFPFYL